VSTLRQRLKHPGSYLLLLALLAGTVFLDATRPPSRQWIAPAYVAVVGAYQNRLSPHLSRLVQCRYTPTCSHYSKEAVQRYGIGRGLELTARRLWRCRSRVPLGTSDPVPTLPPA
jgi:putative membrane protein insertion efficiency factor